MLKRNTKTEDELRKASDAFYYEIWMFNGIVEFLLTQTPPPGEPKYNAIVESFVQHTRNLIEFFYPQDNVRPDTIIAEDFFQDRELWEETIPKSLDDVRIRANKLLAHLTYDRIKDDGEWKYGTIRKIREHLNCLFEKWFQKVPQDRIGDKLKSYKVPPANIIESHNASVIVSTGTACLPRTAVTRDMSR